MIGPAALTENPQPSSLLGLETLFSSRPREPLRTLKNPHLINKKLGGNLIMQVLKTALRVTRAGVGGESKSLVNWDVLMPLT